MNNQPLKPNNTETKNRRKPKMSEQKKIAIISSVSAGVICASVAAFWFLHPHSYSEWKTVKAATCTENGAESRECFCGETETRELLALGHSVEFFESIAPTCTKKGLTNGINIAIILWQAIHRLYGDVLKW